MQREAGANLDSKQHRLLDTPYLNSCDPTFGSFCFGHFKDSTMATPSEKTPLTGGTEGGNGSVLAIKESFRESMRAVSVSMSQHIGKIGFLGSMSIAVNSLTGPAMLNIPDTYQRAGLIPTTATVIFVCILSALCCLHMANTISKVPGNSNYKKEVSD
jgi:hypothetical protein